MVFSRLSGEHETGMDVPERNTTRETVVVHGVCGLKAAFYQTRSRARVAAQQLSSIHSPQNKESE